MARQIIVLALVFVAIVGVASAATEVEVAKQDHSQGTHAIVTVASAATEVEVAKQDHSQGTHHEAVKAPAADHAKAPAADHAKAPAADRAKAPAAQATAPVGQAEDGEAEAPTVGGEVIGATDDAAPTTGELGPAAAEDVTPVADKENGASALTVPAAVAGVVAVAGFLSF